MAFLGGYFILNFPPSAYFLWPYFFRTFHKPPLREV